MEILQLKAFLPAKGEVNLLEGISTEEAARTMTGKDQDAHGEVNVTAGAPFLLPYTNPLSGVLSADGKNVTANLHGHTASLPVVKDADPGSPEKMARYGLFHTIPSASLQKNSMPDGEELRGVYDMGDFGSRWPGGKLETTVAALLSGRALELTIEVRNNGNEAVPMGIGWLPRFRIPSGNRSQATLRVPISTQMEEQPSSHLTTGKAQGRMTVDAGFNVRGGRPLGTDDLNATFVHMKPALFDNGPTVEFQDPESDFGLRLVAATGSINGVSVKAPAGKNYVEISFQANPTSPSGKLLDSESANDGMLQPGKTMQWRVRLELFAPSTKAAQIGF